MAATACSDMKQELTAAKKYTDVTSLAGVRLQFSITHIEIRVLRPQPIIAAERIKTPRMKKTALFPKKE